MELLRNHHVVEISLDHDLGMHSYTVEQIEADENLLFLKGQSEETGLHLVNWMIETRRVPRTVTIHSWNPSGAKAMAARLNRNGYDCAVVPYSVKEK